MAILTGDVIGSDDALTRIWSPRESGANGETGLIEAGFCFFGAPSGDVADEGLAGVSEKTLTRRTGSQRIRIIRPVRKASPRRVG